MRTLAAAFLILLAVPIAGNAKGYRLVPSDVQLQSDMQTTTVTVWSNSDAVVAETDGIGLLIAPRPDMFKSPWIGVTYIILNRNNTETATTVDASSARMFVDGKAIRRYTQAEQLAYLDKRKRSADFWGGISSGFAALNASRTAGKHSYQGTTQGEVVDQYGNKSRVNGRYSGTVVDHDEAQRAGSEAAIARARATEDTMSTMDFYSKQVLELSPEQRTAPPGDESRVAYWTYELPRTKRGATPVRIEVDVGQRHFVFNFDLVR